MEVGDKARGWPAWKVFNLLHLLHKKGRLLPNKPLPRKQVACGL